MKGFFRKIGFTARETAIIISLIFILSAGLIIKYYGWKKPEKFDYSETDKNFEEKTKLDFEKLKDQRLTEVQQERSNEIKKLADSLYNEKDSSIENKDPKLTKPVNINTALQADLMLLPGIGEVIAERIMDYREMNNGFKNAEELMKVKGIGEKKFARIKAYVTVN